MAKYVPRVIGTSEAKSGIVTGLSQAVSTLANVLDLNTATMTDQPMEELYISSSDRFRIYQVAIDKRGWLSSPEVVVKKNGEVLNVAADQIFVDYIGGTIEFLGTKPIASDKITVSATYIIPESQALNKVASATYYTGVGKPTIDSAWNETEKLARKGSVYKDVSAIAQTATDSVVQIESVEGSQAVVEIKANENLLDGTSNEWTEVESIGYGTVPHVVTGTSGILEINKTYTYSAILEAPSPDIPIYLQCALEYKDGENDYVSSPSVLGLAKSSLSFVLKKPIDKVLIRINALHPQSVQYITKYKQIKLELGDTATPWIPSVADQQAGAEMPTYQLTRCGRNLLPHGKYAVATNDKSNLQYHVDEINHINVQLKTLQSVFWYYAYPVEFAKKTLFAIKPSKKYAVKIKNNLNVGYVAIKRNDGGAVLAEPVSFADKGEVVISSLEDITYDNQLLFFDLRKTTDAVNLQDIMIELGSTAHPFEPYQGDTYTITPNVPIKVPMLGGVNTLFVDDVIDIVISYTSSTAGALYKYTGSKWERIEPNHVAVLLKAINEAMPKTGGDFSGVVSVGNKIELRADNEGGNLRIFSPDNTYIEMDSSNNSGARIYSTDANGTLNGQVQWNRADEIDLSEMKKKQVVHKQETLSPNDNRVLVRTGNIVTWMVVIVSDFGSPNVPHKWVFDIPVGYRPAIQCSTACALVNSGAITGSARISVMSSGEIYIITSAVGAQEYLFSMTWYTDNPLPTT